MGGRGPHLDCPEEVAELAVLTLAWTMTSPHRRLRDYATKVLVVMLAPRLGMARALLQQFRGVDDPYVLERLAAIAYAAILTGGEAAPADSMRLAEELRRFVLEDERIPNLVARDAVRGAHEWACATACRRPRTLPRCRRHMAAPHPRSRGVSRACGRSTSSRRETRPRVASAASTPRSTFLCSRWAISDATCRIEGSRLQRVSPQAPLPGASRRIRGGA